MGQFAYNPKERDIPTPTSVTLVLKKTGYPLNTAGRDLSGPKLPTVWIGSTLAADAGNSTAIARQVPII